VITLEGIEKSYRTGANALKVLKGVDVTIQDGELVSIMGSSGSGKSTLLNIIGILDNYDAGAYKIDSRLIWDLSETEAAKLRSEYIGFIFQSFNLIPFKTALENVALPLYYQGIRKKRRNELAMQYLEKVGLANWAHHKPNELSGGQKQRVAIARALITEPKLILADEPTGALDSVTSQEVMDLLKSINEEGKTILIVTHERDIAEQTDRIIYLKDGVVLNDTLVNA
jgi:putative ABC transport system ATP-binding protein